MSLVRSHCNSNETLKNQEVWIIQTRFQLADNTSLNEAYSNYYRIKDCQKLQAKIQTYF